MRVIIAEVHTRRKTVIKAGRKLLTLLEWLAPFSQLILQKPFAVSVAAPGSLTRRRDRSPLSCPFCLAVPLDSSSTDILLQGELCQDILSEELPGHGSNLLSG